MIKYHNRFKLEGFPAKVCRLICYILHNGRGTYDRIIYAIETNGDYQRAYNNLCKIGEANYSTRINTVKGIILKFEKQGVFNLLYESGSNSLM